MRLKKLSVAAALSLGLLTVSGIANAVCPICPQQPVIPQQSCPVPQAVCPTCVPCAPPPTCVSGCVPNEAAGADILKRQVYGYPGIGSRSFVMPKGTALLQVGGAKERVATGNCEPSGLSIFPENGRTATLVPKEMTGGASTLNTVFGPAKQHGLKEMTQGTDVQRCPIPSNSAIFKASCLGALTGKAVPIVIAPINACDPCAATVQGLTGAAAGLDPLGTFMPGGIPVPLNSGGCGCPTGGAAPISCNPVHIQTASGIPVQQTVMEPCEEPCQTAPCPSGGACPVTEQFPDVSNNAFAGCDINKLACNGVLAGYPDRTYKPSLPILRSELASALVSGLQLQNTPGFNQQIFRDVPKSHWAKSNIDKAYNRGLMAGYPNDNFKPNNSVSRAEVLSTMSKVLPGCMSIADAQNVLKNYSDGSEVPNWARMPVAESLNAGLTKELPDCNCIKPNSTASRAEVASMLKQLRTTLCLEPAAPVTACAPCKPTGAAATLKPQVVCSTIPTLKVKMDDLLTARTGEVGDIFRARTIESVTIGGLTYPAGSIVSGRVVEIIRPTLGDHGAIRLAFDNITNTNGDYRTELPKDVLAATVIKENNPNILGRTAALPLTAPGKIIGITGRTVGGVVMIAGNSLEGFGTNFGNGTNELLNAKLRASGRSYAVGLKDVVAGAWDIIKTTGTGAGGVVKETADDVAYVVSPDGARIAQINPYEVVSIAFAAENTMNTACANAIPTTTNNFYAK